MSDTNDTTYNGWTNYETWVVNLWMDNEQASADRWLRRARETVKQEPTEDAQVYALQRAIKESHFGRRPSDINVYAALCRAALDEVNWQEIARSWIEKAREDMKWEMDHAHDAAANRADDERVTQEGL